MQTIAITQETICLLSTPGFTESLNQADQESWFTEEEVEW